MNTDNMTDEQLRVAIAEACGWTRIENVGGYDFPFWVGIAPAEFATRGGAIPDYLNDLNAMHEAEQVMRQMNQFAFYEYQKSLWQVVTGRNSLAMWDVICAESKQRALAFVRCLPEP